MKTKERLCLSCPNCIWQIKEGRTGRCAYCDRDLLKVKLDLRRLEEWQTI